MELSRRQVLLIGGIGALSAGALVTPWGTVAAKSASRLSDSEMPRPYQTTFSQPPVLKPFSVDIDPDNGARTENYAVTEIAATARILPRLVTPILGYNGIFPGPSIVVDQGTMTTLTVKNKLPATHPSNGHVLATSTHLLSFPSPI